MARKSSWKSDETLWRLHIEPYLGHLEVDRIKPIDVQRLILDRMLTAKSSKTEKRFKPATIHHAFTLTRRLYNWALKSSVVDVSNPCDRVEPLRFQNGRTRVLSSEEVGRLVSTLETWENQHAALVVKMAMVTGRRLGELLKLTWDDVDLPNQRVTFRAETTKNRRQQTIPISASAQGVLKAAAKLRSPGVGWVFPASTGKFYSGFEKVWTRIRKAAGLEGCGVCFHTLRHHFASVLASSGKATLHDVSALLGHRDLKTTQRYAHFLPGRLQEVVQAVDIVPMGSRNRNR
jgi:integrase